MKNKIISLLVMLVTVPAVFAHEGLHEPGLANNVGHAFTHPDHWLVLLAIALPVTVALAIYLTKKSNKQSSTK